MLAEQVVPSASAAFVRKQPNEFQATAFAAGPWFPDLCHGGASAALIIEAGCSVPSLVPMSVSRLSLEILKPVPIGPLQLGIDIVRDGKKQQVLKIVAYVAGEAVLSATVLRLRDNAEPGPTLPPFQLRGPSHANEIFSTSGSGFAKLFTVRALTGRFGGCTPASVWFRLDGLIVEGEQPTPLACAVAAADCGNGLSLPVSTHEWACPSTDLTVQFARAPLGPWIMVDAETWIGTEGRALTHARLGDEKGWFGRSLQTSILEWRGASRPECVS